MAVKEAPRKTRVSLTAKQREEGAGAELLCVLQSIAEDGRLTDTEIADLRAWLETHNELDIPGVVFLSTVVTRILEDNIVSEDERKDLQEAIEKVLPPDVRKLVSSIRRSVMQEEREQQRKEREEQREKEREERNKNYPIEHYDFMIAGAKRREYSGAIERLISVNDEVYLVREPNNPHDRNAIKIVKDQVQIGWVPRWEAKELAKTLDVGCRYVAQVRKILGYDKPIPVVDVSIYRSDASVGGAVSSDFRPAGSGCAGSLMMVIIVAGALIYSLCFV